MSFNFDPTISIGNVFTIVTFVGAAAMMLNRHIAAVKAIRFSTEKQEENIEKLTGLAEGQLHFNATVDKRLAILEDRAARTDI